MNVDGIIKANNEPRTQVACHAPVTKGIGKRHNPLIFTHLIKLITAP